METKNILLHWALAKKCAPFLCLTFFKITFQKMIRFFKFLYLMVSFFVLRAYSTNSGYIISKSPRFVRSFRNSTSLGNFSWSGYSLRERLFRKLRSITFKLFGRVVKRRGILLKLRFRRILSFREYVRSLFSVE